MEDNPNILNDLNMAYNIQPQKDQPNLQDVKDGLTEDDYYYQVLLNRFKMNEEQNYKFFDKEEQNKLIPCFIESERISSLEPQIKILANNLDFDDDGKRDIAQNEPYNFIFTIGVGKVNGQRGTHYVAGQIFRDHEGRLIVLHYDSLNGNVNKEFEEYIKTQFGEHTIINIPNENKFTQKNHGTNTCGLCALTALRNGGIIDQERIRIQQQDQHETLLRYHDWSESEIVPHMSELIDRLPPNIIEESHIGNNKQSQQQSNIPQGI